MTSDPRNHPARQLIDQAYGGAPPPAAEIDALTFADPDVDAVCIRRRVKDACLEVARLRREGDNQGAREAAHRLGVEIAGDAGPPARKPDPDTDDPRELARRVPRPGAIF